MTAHNNNFDQHKAAHSRGKQFIGLHIAMNMHRFILFQLADIRTRLHNLYLHAYKHTTA